MKKLATYFLLVTILFGITNPLAAASKGEDSLKEVDLVVYNMSKLTIIKGEMKEFSEAVYKKEDYFMLPLAETLHELGFEVGQTENGIATTASEFSVYNDIVKINEKEFKIETKNDTAYISNQFLVELGYRMFEEKEMLMIYKTDILSKLNVDVIYKMQGIYVSTDSRSGATGTASDPVASLEAAKNIAEKYISVYGDSYPVNIYVHGGSYFFEETVNFKKSYFGRADIKGIAIKAFGDGEPIFTGARKLNPSNFVPVTDAIMLSRLPKDARGRVAVMDLNSENITGLSTSQATFPFIYINDQEMPISQWPNSGFTTTKSTPENGVFGYDGTNPSRWTMANDARIWAYFVGDYFYGTAEIDKVNAQAGLITYSNGPKFPLGSSGRRWKAVNLLEEIDIPGEWYVDRESNKLYLYPPYTLNNAKVEITTLHDKPFIQADEINGLEISGITFEKGGSRAVYCAVPGNNITIKKCRFLYIQGDYAIHIKNYQTTYNLDISENEFYGCAGGAVLAKPGDTITLTPSNSKITNNRVTSCGYYPAYINAVFMGSENSRANHNAVETVIENNLIQDCTTVYAMSLTGFENKFRYNEIVNQSKYVDDGGAIYFGMSYHKYGNEIAYNYLHDFNMEHFLCGLYNDDAYSGAYWHNNICYNIPRVSINGTGRNQKTVFNIGINCNAGITAGSRSGGGYAKGNQLDLAVDSFLEQSGEYLKQRYPTYYEQIVASQKHVPYDTPIGSVYYGNVGIGTPIGAVNSSVTEYGAEKFDYNGQTIDIKGKNATAEGNLSFDYSDEYFEDPKSQNWNIKKDSEIAKAFPQIADYDIEDIGIKTGGERLLEKPDGFALKGPYNGEEGVQTKKVVLSWDRAKNATFYEIKIATEPEMTNVVFETKIRENGNNNFIEVENLSNDTVYYWRVKAIGVARQNQFEVESYGPPYMFKTANKNRIDLDNLNLAINAVNEFYDSITTTDEYEYDTEFIKEVSETIEKANQIKRTSSNQDEINEMEEKIYSIIRKSPFYMIVHFANIDGIYSNDVEWLLPQAYMQGSVTWEDGILTIKTAVEGSRYEPYTQHIGNSNSILVFDVKFADLADGGGYQGFDFKMPMKGDDMLVVFKESIIEWQPHGTLIEMPNPFIEADQWYRIAVGGINTPNGVLQYMSVDGHVIYAELDQSTKQVREEGRFRIRANGTGNIQMRPVSEDELPKDQTLIKDILNSLYNPVNEKHLNAMLIGSYDAIEAGTSLFYAVDKADFSHVLYNQLDKETNDYSKFKNTFDKSLVLTAYRLGLADFVYENNIKLNYTDYLQPQLIDVNGVNIYSFYENRIKDVDRGVINKAMLKGDYMSFDEWRRAFAKNIFIRCMNICNMSFAGTTDYMYELLTQENSNYIGIDISSYLALSNDDKNSVHQMIRNAKSEARTIDELLNELEQAVNSLQ